MSIMLADAWYNTIAKAIEDFITPLLIILCSAGMIYAIIIGIKMLKAEKKEDREENKARLINIGISLLAVFILIGVFYFVKRWVLNDGLKNDASSLIPQTPQGPNSSGG